MKTRRLNTLVFECPRHNPHPSLPLSLCLFVAPLQYYNSSAMKLQYFANGGMGIIYLKLCFFIVYFSLIRPAQVDR